MKEKTQMKNAKIILTMAEKRAYHEGERKGCDAAVVDMTNLLNQQGQLFLLLALGLWFRRKGILDGAFEKGLTDLILKLVLPCSIVQSFRMEFNGEILRQTSAILIVSTLLQLGCWVLALTVYRRMTEDKRPVVQYATLCSNATFLGTPVVDGVFGSYGTLLAAVYLTPQRIAMWTVGIGFFTKNSSQKLWKKVLLNPCIDAVAVGLMLLVTQWQLPVVLGNTIKTLGSCNTGLSMFLVGMICSDVNWKDFLDKDTLYFSFIRLVLIPGLLLAACRLAGVDELITGVSVLLAAMPAGATTAILAAKHNGNAHFAAGCLTVSIILSLVAIPAWCLVL